MAAAGRPALGLSIGATNLAAVTADVAITRKPVLTLYRQRAPEVGVPSENPRLDEPGLVLRNFVNSTGNPVGIAAADGSMHRSEALLADALRALAYTATGGRALPDSVTVTYPAHWRSAAVDALGAAMSRVSEWSQRAHPLALIPDTAAALFALRINPGIPSSGVVVVCDFGGTGTNITLVDAAAEYQPLAPTLRHHDLSGDLIDQALLTYLMADLPTTSPFDPAARVTVNRSLTGLRAACRGAKEQLSSSVAVTLAGPPLPGNDTLITRADLDDAMHDSLDNFLSAVDGLLLRNGVTDVAAVVSVGGGANNPAVTTALSRRLEAPVVSTPHPHLTAAIGGALRAARGLADDGGDAAAHAVHRHRRATTAYQDMHVDGPLSSMSPALDWADAEEPVSRSSAAPPPRAPLG